MYNAASQQTDRGGARCPFPSNLASSKQVQLPQGTIRYRERGTGEPIVFVHGLLVNGDLWRKVVPELVEGLPLHHARLAARLARACR